MKTAISLSQISEQLVIQLSNHFIIDENDKQLIYSELWGGGNSAARKLLPPV